MQDTAAEAPHISHRTKPSSNIRSCWFWAGWEPDRYYRRIGARKTPYFGNGDWVLPWRETLESAACLDSLAQSGATVLVTRFYKGFGPEIERQDWPSLQAFVERAHDAGLEVWGYLQGQSLFGEFLFNERPEASDWVAKNHKGESQLWAGAYNRYAPCLTSLAYREMMEGIIEEGLTSVNLDGIHMDNNYYRHCYCPRCKDLFREWLTRRGDLELRTGISVADYVEPPPLVAESSLVPDPLAILWMEFGVQTRLNFMRAIRDKIRQCKPEASFAGNPAFLRTYSSRLTHALDPAEEGRVCDSLCVENGNQPRYENGRLFTQADKHLFAEAAGLGTWVTSWRPGPFGSSPPASPASIWAGLAEEFSFANAFLGNNWALRPAGDGNKLLRASLPDEWKAFGEALQFFQGLDRRLAGHPRRQWGEFALYMDPRAFSICPQDAGIFQAFLLAALNHHLPFKILLRGQPLAPETHTVIIVQHRSLDEAEFQRLTHATRKCGSEIWLVGECGTYDEWCVPRSQRLWQAWDALPHLRSISISVGDWLEKEDNSAQYLKGRSPELRETGQLELRQTLAALRGRQSFHIDADAGILSNIEKSGENGWFIHLRNLNPVPPTQPVRIRFSTALLTAPEFLGYSPGVMDGMKIPFLHQDGRFELLVPSFESYAGILVRSTS